MGNLPTGFESESDVQALRRRLAELERENETLRATARADQAAGRDALEALVATEQRLRRAQEAGGVGVFTIDLQNNTLLATPELCRIFGLPVRESMPAETVERLVIPEDSDAVSHTEARRAADIELATEYRIRRADNGQERCIARWAEFERDATGKPVKLLGVLQDVTERRAAQRALEKSADELTRLNQNLEREVAQRTADRNRLWQLSSDIMLVARNDGTIVAANPAWTSMLGWSQQDVIGTSAFALVHPDDAEASRLAGTTLAGGNPVGSFDNRYRHRDGSYRWISWAAVAGDGFVSAVGRDLTSQKEQAEALHLAEEALRQSQKMEAVGQLTGGLAHDFNNLLVGITASLELMQLRIKQGRTAELDRYVQAAQSSARRAASLTHRLLAFSRRQTLDPKPTDVSRLVIGMEELVRRTVGATVDLEVVTAAGLWTALVDPHQLENALLNLCINARDAMPDGGRLTIETANRRLDERSAKERELQPGQYLVMSVSDTGTGMSSEVIQRAFEPFFTTKPIGMGTGLGLSMVYGFARQSGGQVRVHSHVGQGTTMSLFLPRHVGTADLDAAESPISNETPHLDARVLVIDDEFTVRAVVVEVMREMGYDTLEASDGASGMRLLESDAGIDLLITDVGLPGGLNGRQVADAARMLRPGLKVLFITGYAEHAVMGQGHFDPSMQVLTKPFTIDSLSASVENLLK